MRSREYFPDAMVYGIDIEDTSHLNSDRLKTFIADQSNRIQLKDVMDVTGGDFDIIIDDGGHGMNLQQISLGFLFKYVKRGGFYIIEDVHTSLYELHRDHYGAEKSGENTTLFMIEHFVRNGKIRSQYMTAEEAEYLTANIKYCSLVSRRRGQSITCIFKKNERESKATRAYLEPPPGAITITLFRIVIFFSMIFILIFFIVSIVITRKRNKQRCN